MKRIPPPSKRRLIALSKLLEQFSEEKITSQKIEELTGWKETTVRKDISYLKPGIFFHGGYTTSALKESIQQELCLLPEKKLNCCIVGLGKIGESLLERSLFDKSPFSLAAAFDPNQNRLDLIKTDVPLFATIDLEQKIRQLSIEYAILAVSDDKAVFMAERLHSYGIKGILNYTNKVLPAHGETKIIQCSPSFLLENLL